jgi:hypothetical protein
MDASNTTCTSTHQYALYQPEYDAENNPQWQTHNSPAQKSFGQLLCLTGSLLLETATPASIATGTMLVTDTPVSLATMLAPVQKL